MLRRFKVYNALVTVYNNKEIYGPFQPTLASGSNSTIPSCHAEVHAAKYIYSIKSFTYCLYIFI